MVDNNYGGMYNKNGSKHKERVVCHENSNCSVRMYSGAVAAPPKRRSDPGKSLTAHKPYRRNRTDYARFLFDEKFHKDIHRNRT